MTFIKIIWFLVSILLILLGTFCIAYTGHVTKTDYYAIALAVVFISVNVFNLVTAFVYGPENKF